MYKLTNSSLKRVISSFLLILFLSGLSIGLIPTEGYGQGEIIIEGTVTDIDTGLPLEGVEVYNLNISSFTPVTFT